MEEGNPNLEPDKMPSKLAYETVATKNYLFLISVFVGIVYYLDML